MHTTPPPAEQIDETNPLGDRLRRLASWADATPRHQRVAVARAIDRLAVQLGAAVARDTDPTDTDR